MENTYSWRLTPDRSENPFCFFFKNKKIEADSGNKAGKIPELLGAKIKTLLYWEIDFELYVQINCVWVFAVGVFSFWGIVNNQQLF